MNLWIFCVLCCCLYPLICNAEVTYTDQWAVHVLGGEAAARQIAEKHGFTFLGEIMPDYYHFRHRHVSKRSIYPGSHIHEPLTQDPDVRWAEQQLLKKRVKRDIQFNDPKWPRMWYLNRGRGLDMNVMPAWESQITGKGVVVSILDDGIERDHPDLKKNYDPEASYDVNGHDKDPTPRYDYTNENRHGTRCAGQVAAEAGNGVCSVGVAYNAGIGGVRMLDGDVTDSVEARSLSYNPQHIDIYSASWGPDDDGQTVDGPAILAKKAFEDGIKKGRAGKGSIFVWASGNGGRDGDGCNCDGYTNSIYTLSISSATENGNIPWYSEACSSTLTTTYSSGSGGERQIVTTDLRKDCTEYHTGTSASAPLAAGLCALVLQANPNLTWRDLQHIVVETSRPANLNAEDWVVNGVGKKVSHHFGFGLMDASAMVNKAMNWTNVPEQHRCEIKAVMKTRKIAINSAIEVMLESNGCHGSSNEVLYLEHVQAIITLGASRRGQVEIYLTSPAGTRSTLLAKRSKDSSTEGFTEWAFMTTHNWGEVSMGQWTLRVENAGASSVLRDWSLVLYGTASHPHSDSGHLFPIKPTEQCAGKEVFFEGKCQEKCPSTFYATNETYRLPENATGEDSSEEVSSELDHWVLTCARCHAYCYECHGPSSHECFTCTDGYQLQNTSCVYEYKKDILGFFLSHQKGTIIAVLALCGFCAILVFIVTFGVLQCHSHGYCTCCCKKKPQQDYMNKGRRPDDGRINLTGKNMNLRNGNPEWMAQEEGLLATHHDLEYEDDEEEEVNFEPVPYSRNSGI